MDLTKHSLDYFSAGMFKKWSKHENPSHRRMHKRKFVVSSFIGCEKCYIARCEMGGGEACLRSPDGNLWLKVAR